MVRWLDHSHLMGRLGEKTLGLTASSGSVLSNL